MAYTAVPTVTTGDLWTAANHNTYIRDNFAAGVPDIYTAAGDISYSSAANVSAVLAIGSAKQILSVNSGANAPEWVTGGMFLISDTVVAGTAVASIDLTSIPQTYKHLQIDYSLVGDTAAAGNIDTLALRVNNVTGSTYDYQYIDLHHATATLISYQALTAWGFSSYVAGAGLPTGQQTPGRLIFPNYTNTSTLPSGLCLGSFVRDGTGTGNYRYITGGFTERTAAAISRITIFGSSGNLDIGSRVTLYGYS